VCGVISNQYNGIVRRRRRHLGSEPQAYRRVVVLGSVRQLHAQPQGDGSRMSRVGSPGGARSTTVAIWYPPGWVPVDATWM